MIFFNLLTLILYIFKEVYIISRHSVLEGIYHSSLHTSACRSVRGAVVVEVEEVPSEVSLSEGLASDAMRLLERRGHAAADHQRRLEAGIDKYSSQPIQADIVFEAIAPFCAAARLTRAQPLLRVAPRRMVITAALALLRLDAPIDPRRPG
jgi:hypothetical protein